MREAALPVPADVMPDFVFPCVDPGDERAVLVGDAERTVGGAPSKLLLSVAPHTHQDSSLRWFAIRTKHGARIYGALTVGRSAGLAGRRISIPVTSVPSTSITVACSWLVVKPPSPYQPT